MIAPTVWFSSALIVEPYKVFRVISHKVLDCIEVVSNLTLMTQTSGSDEFHLEFTTYGPSEVSRMTGVSGDLLRDWRRRGIIKASDAGSSVYNTLHVAQIMLRRALSDVGVPLTESGKSADLGAVYVLNYAGDMPRAIDAPIDMPPAVLGAAITKLMLPPVFRYLLVIRPRIRATEMPSLPPDTAAAVEQFDGLIPLPTLELGLEILGSLQKDNRAEAWSIVDLRALGEKLARLSERPICKLRSGPSRATNPVIAHTVRGG